MSETRVVLDTKEWDSFISGVSGKMKDVAGLLSAAANMFAFKDIIDHFSKEEGPDGRWADRKEPYKSLMERKGYTKILQVTGNLRQSISPANMSRSGRNSITIFANAPYSGALDEGTSNMKARPFMWLSDDVQQKMVDAILAMAMEGA